MSGISFKISAPSRPTSNSANAAPSSSRHASAPTARNGHPTRGQGSDSDEDDDRADTRHHGRDSKRRKLLGNDDEEVVEFGQHGATSKHAKPTPAGPLVIPALPNKDWRKAAEELRFGRKKREIYLPEQGGGMRTAAGDRTTGATTTAVEVDRVNADEVVGGLETRERRPRTEGELDGSTTTRGQQGAATQDEETKPSTTTTTTAQVPETEEQRALRELLGEAGGAQTATDEPVAVEAIVSAEDARNGPIDEADAFKRDVESRPDMASLEDYARVPVGAFGLAMLRGMGWEPGQAASRTGRGAIEAHVPSSRPALLGIGAKPMAEPNDGAGNKGRGANAASSSKGRGPQGKSRRDEMKFVPLVKQVREGSGSGRSTPLAITEGGGGGRGSSTTSSSRRPSRSPPRSPPSSSLSSSRRDRERGQRDRSPGRRERSERDYRDRDRDRERERDRDRDDRRASSRYDVDDHRSRTTTSRYEDERRDRNSSRYGDDDIEGDEGRDRKGSSSRRRDDRDRDRDRYHYERRGRDHDGDRRDRDRDREGRTKRDGRDGYRD